MGSRVEDAPVRPRALGPLAPPASRGNNVKRFKFGRHRAWPRTSSAPPPATCNTDTFSTIHTPASLCRASMAHIRIFEDSFGRPRARGPLAPPASRGWSRTLFGFKVNVFETFEVVPCPPSSGRNQHSYAPSRAFTIDAAVLGRPRALGPLAPPASRGKLVTNWPKIPR